MRRFLSKYLVGPFVGIALTLLTVTSVLAATTADINLTATPTYIAITVDQASFDFLMVVESVDESTTTSYFTIDNTSSVSTNQAISVTTNTWSGGVTWTHSDTATPGSDTAGLLANKGGTWGVGDVIVKFASPNNIAAAQAANTDYSFGLKLKTPTAFGDGVQKAITVRVTATAA